ncbi:hypothetical protein IWX62_000651 [Arthrobacter sp. CAN_A1]
MPAIAGKGIVPGFADLRVLLIEGFGFWRFYELLR